MFSNLLWLSHMLLKMLSLSLNASFSQVDMPIAEEFDKIMLVLDQPSIDGIKPRWILWWIVE